MVTSRKMTPDEIELEAVLIFMSGISIDDKDVITFLDRISELKARIKEEKREK